MIPVQKDENGQWRALPAGPTVVTRMADTARRQDGQEVRVEPYPVQDNFDSRKVQQLLVEGVWTEDELRPYGLRGAIPFKEPDGQRRVAGAPQSFVEHQGYVYEIYQTEDIPPPPVLTPEEKLAKAGLSPEEVDNMVDKAVQRLAAKAEQPGKKAN